jgi:pimeloyl-ACP methyl ester carboxylesterase
MPIAGGLYYFSHLVEQNTRPPVILIHDAGGDHLYWPPEVRRMTGQRIYAPDLPGHGKSSGIGRQSVSDYARSILDFMNDLKISQSILIGHSMGAAIALTLALDHPRRVLGLGAISGGLRLRVSADLMDNAASSATFPIAIKSFFEKAFSTHTPKRIKEPVLLRMAETRPTVLHGDFLACNNFDIGSRVGKIQTPTLILCGLDDQVTPVSSSEYLVSQIKTAYLSKIEDAGHMVMLEKPREVAFILEEFINKIAYQPGS